MTIPDKPLNLRGEDLTLDDTEWMLEWMTRKTADVDSIRRLKAILSKVSDWTAEELGRVTWGELATVLAQVNVAQEAERESAVPLPTESD